MKDSWAVFAFIFCALAMGCLSLEPPASDEPNANTFTLNGSGNTGGVGRPSCTLMFCRNGASWFDGWWYSLFHTYISEMTLYQGGCSFVQKSPKQIEQFLINSMSDGSIRSGSGAILFPDSVPPGSDFIRHFMYGQGPTFAEFDDANTYCLDNMSMAVKWIKWDPTMPTTPPYVGITGWEASLQRSRAECYLKANVIPVYVFYTNSTAIDPGNIERFVSNFKDSAGKYVGPIVICPEFGYQLNKPGVKANMADAINRIRTVCPDKSKCLIMLAPPEDDIGAIESMETYDPNLIEKVDIIGQSWTLNKDEKCSFVSTLDKKITFSKSVLANYGKPTLWAYLAAGNTTNFQKTCNWTENDIADAYDMIFINAPGLAAAGGIGLGHYQFIEGTDATFSCSGPTCNYGLLDSNEQQKQPMFNRWFNRCKGYYDVERDPSGNVLSTNRAPIVFNTFGDNGSECNVMSNLGAYTMLRVTTAPEPTGPVPMVKPPVVYLCDRCFGNITLIKHSVLELTASYPMSILSPHTWYYLSTSFFDDMHLALAWHQTSMVATPDYCNFARTTIRKQSEIACEWEMDPLFVRAVMNHDSSFDKCNVEYTRMSDTTCNPFNIIDFTSSPKGPVTDPEGACASTRTDLRWDPVNKKCVPSANPAWERCKPCTFGSMRCTKLPYQWGGAPLSTPIPPYTASEPFGCGPNFNPFNLQGGVCCGTNKLCESLKKAVNWAYDNPTIKKELVISTSKDQWPVWDRDRWTILLLALAVYHNNGEDSILNTYYAHWQRTKWCPSSVTTFSNSNGIVVNPEGPAKTFIWYYCNAYNDSGYVFRFYGFNDPLLDCRANSAPGTCHIGCGKDSLAPGVGYYQPTAFDPGTNTTWNPAVFDPSTLWAPAFDQTDTNGDGISDFVNVANCVTAPECLTPYGGSYYCPDQFFSLNPATFRCNRPGQGYCCGGSFFEHLCCMDPYACEVLSEYNKTVNNCPDGRFCNRASS